MKKVYLDANSNYGLLEHVKENLVNMPHIGNPQSIHFYGQALKAIVEETRESVKNFIKADDFNIYFCSGATEAANWLSYFVSRILNSTNSLMIVSKVEHACVIESARQFVNSNNRVEITLDYRNSNLYEQMIEKIKPYLDRVKVIYWMHSNNETGVIFPLKEVISELKQKKDDILVISDIVQSVCKLDNLDLSYLDCWFFSGHKIGALPGVGVVGAKKKLNLHPFIVGGSQEQYKRGGTENYQAIWSLNLALDYWRKLGAVEATYKAKKEILKSQIMEKIPSDKVSFLFEHFDTIPNTLHLVVPGRKSSDLLVALDIAGVCCSAGSTCYSGKPIPPTLEGFGVPNRLAEGALRLSFRSDIIEEEINFAVEKLRNILSS